MNAPSSRKNQRPARRRTSVRGASGPTSTASAGCGARRRTGCPAAPTSRTARSSRSCATTCCASRTKSPARPVASGSRFPRSSRWSSSTSSPACPTTRESRARDPAASGEPADGARTGCRGRARHPRPLPAEVHRLEVARVTLSGGVQRPTSVTSATQTVDNKGLAFPHAILLDSLSLCKGHANAPAPSVGACQKHPVGEGRSRASSLAFCSAVAQRVRPAELFPTQGRRATR